MKCVCGVKVEPEDARRQQRLRAAASKDAYYLAAA
jgi:hypothetical protein